MFDNRSVFRLQDHFGYNSVQLGITWYNSVQLSTTPFEPVLKPSKTELYRVVPSYTELYPESSGHKSAVIDVTVELAEEIIDDSFLFKMDNNSV